MNEFLYNILAWINSWIGNWGWAMVVFTLMIRLVLTPLDIKSRVSMRKTTKLQPQLQALQKKYANDKDKLNQKTAELYRKEKINPLSSCLPLLLTWPVLIAVFAAMRMVANKELLIQVGQILNGQTPTLEPWLWVKNLWMPDNVFSAAYPDLNTLRVIPTDQWVAWFRDLQTTGVPAALANLGLTEASFEGGQLGATVQSIVDVMNQMSFYSEAVATIPGATIPLVNWSVPHLINGFLLLPILSAVSQIVMTKITGTGAAPQNQQASKDNPAAGTGKFMQWFFPIFSLWICLGYSAAFALYWVAGNVIMLLQTLIINKVLDSKEARTTSVAGEGKVI